jgi:glutamate-1-semialdehyde aminotransferase
MKKYFKGINLYKKASSLIPGGVQLLSKRPELFLPDQWPSYYKHAKGCSITTLDNNKLYDFTNCSVGMCPLGYANDAVNRAVIRAIIKGNTSTLNSYLEYECAKLLIKIHPWSEMARFTKSGGEAMSVAVRIARTYTNKSKVLFCGYHGWHDWYISANLKNTNKLNNHLLPGISSLGIPKELSGLAEPFEFNNKLDFEKKFFKSVKKLSCVVLEPARAYHCDLSFVKTIRKLCTKFNVPLIFDEITLGWHYTLGGYHKAIKIDPDIAVFSKGTTNGFPLGVILGKKKIMKSTTDSFISSAYWTENIGFAAAITTINYMKKNKVPEKLILKGRKIKKIWSDNGSNENLPIVIKGIDSLPSFSFNHSKSDEIITFFTQEMLKEGFLAHGSCFMMTAHSDKIIKKYKKACENVFKKISDIFYNHNCNFKKYINGRVKFAKFKNPV